jgi:hypothetical protein
MPKLPDYTAFGDAHSPKISTSVPSYGAPQDIGEGIAKGLDRFREIYKEIEAQREKENLLRAEDVYNQLQLAETELAKGENGYLTKQGKDVMTQDIVKDYGSKFRQKQIELAQTLGNDRQRELFTARGEIAFIRHQDATMTHKVNQSKVYGTSVYKATEEITKNNAVTNYKNPNVIESEVVRLASGINTEGQSQGWSKEQIEKEIAVKTSNVHRAVIDRYLANEETGGANSYFKTNKASIKDDKDLIHIESKLREGNTLASAQQLADKIMETHGTNFDAAIDATKKAPSKVREKAEELVRKYVADKRETVAQEQSDIAYDKSNGNFGDGSRMIRENNPDSRTRTLAEAKLEARINDKVKIDKLNDDENFGDKLKRVKAAGTIDVLTSREKRSLSEKQQEYINLVNTEREPTQEESEKARNKADMFISNNEKLGALSELDYELIAKDLSVSDRAFLEERRTYAVKMYKATIKELRAERPKTSEIDKKVAETLRQSGVIPYIKKEMTPEHHKILGASIREAVEIIKGKESKNKGVGLEVEDVNNIISKVATKYIMVTPKGMWLGGTYFNRVSNEIIDKGFEPIPIKNIPLDHQNSLIELSKAKLNGHIPSNPNIEKAYAYHVLMAKTNENRKLDKDQRIILKNVQEKEVLTILGADYKTPAQKKEEIRKKRKRLSNAIDRLGGF